MKTAIYYKKESGKRPFKKWLNNLDTTLKIKVQTKIRKLENGNDSDCTKLKSSDGIKEARIRTASGLRIYFAEENNQIIILLAGGDKDTQKKDIKLAKEYWQDHKQQRLQ